MIKPDLIVSWPDNSDYPLWRQLIRDNREKFAQVIIVFTKSNTGIDYSPFVSSAMANDRITFLTSPEIAPGQDWRDVAVNAALAVSKSEMIFFTEQDFFPRRGFWEEVEVQSTYHNILAAYDGPRMHPCCIFISRKILDDKTSRNFGIVPGKLDHFGLIQQALEENLIHVNPIPTTLWYHMAGLSHNFRLITEDQLPNHKPSEFRRYLLDCLAVKVPLSPIWVDIVNKFLAKSG